MLGRIRDLFASEPEPRTVPVHDAVSFFAEERGDRLDVIQDREQELRDRTRDALTTVDDALDDLAGFEDEDGYAVVDDVTDNIVDDRRRLIDQFAFPGSPEELYEEIDAFVEEFGQVTQKEQAILDRIGDPARNAFSRLDAVKEAKKEVGAFLESEHTVRERYETLKEQVSALERLESELEDLRSERADIALEPVKQRVEEKEEALEAHREKDAWDEKAELEDRIASLESDRDDVISRVEKASGKMERGMKKLLYQARNEDITLSQATINTLEKVRDGDILHGLWNAEGAEEVQDAVSTAVELMPDDLLGDRQHERFMDGADTFQELPALQQEVSDIQQEISDLEEELDAFDLEAEEDRLEQEVADAEEELQERAERRKELGQQIREHEQEIDRVTDEIEATLDDALPGDIQVKRPS